MDIRHYAALQREKVGKVLEREKLTCYYRATVQGPLTLTWRMQPHNASTGTLRRLLAMGSVLQSELRVESVRVQQVDGLIEIAIPSPSPMTPNADQILAGTNGLQVSLGLDAAGQHQRVDLARHGSVAWVGPSRRGKTQSMRSTLYGLSRSVQGNLRYAIICQQSKLADWQIFDQSKHSLGIVTAASEIVRCVNFFAELCQVGRAGNMEFILLIDDLPSILAIADLAKPLATIAGVGAGVGVHVLLGTQALGSNAGSGGTLVESNTTARTVYKPASKSTGARNAGSGGLATDDLTSQQGDAILLVDGHPERIATAYCPDHIAANLPQGRLEKWHHLWLRLPASALVRPSGSSGSSGSLSGSRTGSGTGSSPVLTLSTPVESNQAGSSGSGGSSGSAGPFTLPSNTMPSLDQRILLYAEYKRLGSGNATQRSVFGCKNGNTATWLNLAIRENQPTDDDGADTKIINLAERRIA